VAAEPETGSSHTSQVLSGPNSLNTIRPSRDQASGFLNRAGDC